VVEEDATRNCPKRIFRFDIRKYTFCNRVIDNWNSLSAGCVNCNTINTFKKHLSPELKSEAVRFYSKPFKIVGSIWRKPVLTGASIVCDIAGVGELGEFRELLVAQRCCD